MSDTDKITWIIGDIHGMYDPLAALVSDLDDERLAKFVFVGDYIDHGPSSKEVLDLVMGLGDRAIPLMGNHEHLLLQTLYDARHRKHFGKRIWLENGAASTLAS
ncbi:MAG: serine/threonine protein phosphatase, partial [Gammaproteobacteria bacterium HGW-Gammaproteobacteria-7]